MQVTEGDDAKSPPRIENKLDTHIKYLLLRNTLGEYFAGESIAANKAQPLAPVTLKDANTALSKLAQEVRPGHPEGFDPNDLSNLFVAGNSRRWRLPNDDSSEGDPRMDVSLLETNLAVTLAPVRYPPLPGTYVAVVETSPVVITGLPRAREEASLHVIRGTY